MRTFHQRRFVLLLCALVLLLLLSPIFESLEIHRVFLGLIFSLVFVLTVYIAAPRRGQLVVALCLAVPALVLTWIDYEWASIGVQVGARFLGAGLFCLTIAIILQQILAADKIDSNMVCGGVSIYLLIGLVWASTYAVIHLLAPGSFENIESDPQSSWNQFIYFSLANLTTLGYGDIVPLTPFSRIWAALEAATGLLYLAVFIARLVTAHRR